MVFSLIIFSSTSFINFYVQNDVSMAYSHKSTNDNNVVTNMEKAMAAGY